MRLLILAAACVAAGTVPAAAQLFQVPSQRTIVLSPGWHLAGPPVRSSDGLRFAVRSDAGVMRDMTVLPNGAITFAPQTAAPERKARTTPPAEKRKARLAPRPAPVAKPQDSSAKTSRPDEDAKAIKPDDGAKKVSAKLETEGGPAPSPAAKPAPVAAPGPSRAATPAPAPSGPGFAHGVPINPLD